MTEVSAVILAIGFAAYLAALIRDIIAYNKISREYENKNEETVDQTD